MFSINVLDTLWKVSNMFVLTYSDISEHILKTYSDVLSEKK